MTRILPWAHLGLLISGLTLTAASSAAPERRVTVQFRGPLKEALKRIASLGGVNLVVIGDLDQPADVYLKDASPEEALKTVAKAYHLQIDQQGSIWTLRPLEKRPEPPSRAPRESAPPPSTPPTTQKESQSDEEESEDEDEQHHQDTKVLEGREARQKLKELGRKLRHRHFGRAHDGDRVEKGDLVIAEGETVNNVMVYGGTLTINGESADAVAIGGSVKVNGHVDGSVIAVGGSVHLGPKAEVEGDVTAIGGGVTKEEGAEVGGDQVTMGSPGLAVLKGLMPHPPNHGSGIDWDDSDKHVAHHGFLKFLIYFALLFGAGFLFFMLAPNRMKQVESDVRSEPVRCGLTGLVGMLALLPLIILLVIIVIGIPFAVVLCIAAPIGVVMGVCAIAHEIGMRLPWFKLRKTEAGVLAVGTLVLLLVAMVPVLGPLTMFLIVLMAFGAIIRTRFGQRPKGGGLPEPVAAVPV